MAKSPIIYNQQMNIDSTIDSVAVVENAGGLYYFVFPYMSSVGKTDDPLSVRVPMQGKTPSAKDKTALIEAISVQGGLGEWVLKDDGKVGLMGKS